FIRWEVEEVSELKARGSAVKFAAGLPWWVMLRLELADPANDIPHLSCGIHCNEESECDKWAALIESSITMCNEDPTKNKCLEFECKYSKSKSCFGSLLFQDMATVLDCHKGFIKDDKIVIEARLTVKRVIGIPKPLEFDFSTPSVGSDNVALIIQGEKVYVSKNYLAIHSPVFKAMFFGDFDEKEKDEIELKDLSRECFIELLYVIYPSYRPITMYWVRGLLLIADRYDIKVVINQAESYLIKTNKDCINENLLIADQYRLNTLKLHCLNTFKTPKELKALEKAPEYRQFSDAMKASILSKVFSLID
ncbi:hypothetical protein PFISCL1PPCAC_20932, partial [Pristionchus fissidentatus]